MENDRGYVLTVERRGEADGYERLRADEKAFGSFAERESYAFPKALKKNLRLCRYWRRSRREMVGDLAGKAQLFRSARNRLKK